MRNSLIYFLSIFAILLTGCGPVIVEPPQPVMQTDTSYVPPKSSGGLMCISACEMARSQCKQTQDMNVYACQRQAHRDYEHCKIQWDREREEGKHHTFLDKVLTSCELQTCNPDYSSCDQGYTACYQNCGGKIITNSHCVANCH